MYIDVIRYLLEAYTLQKSFKYLNNYLCFINYELFTIIISQNI